MIHKLIFANIHNFIEQDDTAHLPPIVYRIQTKCRMYTINHPMTQEEAHLALSFMDDPKFKEIVDREVSFIIVALELMRLYIEKVDNATTLNINKGKLLMSYRIFVEGMLTLKQIDRERYEEKRKTIDDSKDMALALFSYIYNKLEKYE